MNELESDPRLTAYVLDELDPQEREEFERELESKGASVDDFSDDIKEIAQMLEQLYADEPEYRMTDNQREAVLDPSDAEGGGNPSKVVRMLPIVGLGLAACLVAGTFVWLDQRNEKVYGAVADSSVVNTPPPSPPLGQSSGEGKGGRMPSLGIEGPKEGAAEFDSFIVARAESIRESRIDPIEKEHMGDVELEIPADEAVVMDAIASVGNKPSEPFGHPVPAPLLKKKAHPGSIRRYEKLQPDAEGGFAAELSSELYDKQAENEFKDVLEGRNQLSTFSIDVDTASYANVRRFINSQSRPPKSAVRVEEMVNYFRYDYPQPEGEHPFSANVEIAACPWKKGHRLVRIGLKGLEIEAEERPAANLVFLVDASGSMDSSDKLGLLKTSMMKLTQTLREQDTISIVAYAGRSGLVLSPTSGAQKETIVSALAGIRSAGGTNGGEGIQMAYRLAKENLVPGGVNRVILATDGDFNVGVTDQDELVKMVANRAADDDIFLTVLGFGRGNLKDSTMEKIANRGNGNYFYLDSPKEGEKVLVEEVGATLVTIAKDVKAQIEFNPAKVESYRLIGYENRMLKARDFNDDKKDAGEVGVGHTVTALYQIVPAGSGEVDPLKYGAEKAQLKKNKNPELLTLKLRYKEPEGTKSKLFEVPVIDAGKGWEESSVDFRFASAVAGYGMLLQDSEFKGDLNFPLVKELAAEGIERDPKGRRKEFLELVDKASKLSQ